MRHTLTGFLCAVGFVGWVHATDDYEIKTLDTLTFNAPAAELLPPRSAASAAQITALLRIPSGQGPFPAVVIAHGCSGVLASLHRWAEELRKEGIATLLVNSLTGRASSITCHGNGVQHPASFVSDLYAARRALTSDSRIDAKRIAVLGFSNGGRSALWSRSARFREAFGGGEGFAAYLAFYPGCMARLADETANDGATVRIFQGARDDLARPEPCREYVGRLAAAGVRASMLEYPQAAHGFDSGDLSDRRIATVLNYSGCHFVESAGALRDEAGREARIDSPCVTRGGSIAFHEASRQQASQDLRATLKAVFQPRKF
jgi:dienelactone hydrolase